MLIEYNILNGGLDCKFDDNNVYESNRVLIVALGRLVCNINPSFEERLCCCPSEYFTGPFILIIYSKTEKLLTIKQGFFGGSDNLFFCRKDNSLFISDGLRSLKEAVNIPFEINTGCLTSFIYNGFVPGDNTLIKNVFKLAPGCELRISTSGIMVNKIEYRFFKDIDAKDPEEEYAILMQNAIKRSIMHLDSNKYNVALSGGYDSNCILHYIKEQHPNSVISAFSVGGARGIDETETAYSISKLYDKTEFFSSLVDTHTLDNIDEITYLLDGCVYERGIFMQYELGKLLKEKGCRSVVCGECADQVFHCGLFDKASDDTFIYGYWNNPFEMASNVVLKKSVLTMNHFGVEPVYPFLDNDLLKFAYSLRNENGRTKEFHKKMCSKILSPKVIPFLAKQGGTTSMAALFDESFDCIAAAKKMKYYDNNFKLTEKYPPDEAAYDYYLTLLFLDSFEKQFCDK